MKAGTGSGRWATKGTTEKFVTARRWARRRPAGHRPQARRSLGDLALGPVPGRFAARHAPRAARPGPVIWQVVRRRTKGLPGPVPFEQDEGDGGRPGAPLELAPGVDRTEQVFDIGQKVSLEGARER